MKVIAHNSVSLDGSLNGFAVNLAVHYRIAAGFKADIHLVGSNTALQGLKALHRKLPAEREQDLAKPRKNPKLPLWVIPDSAGKLKGKLHVLRQSGYCRDVVILTASHTPKGYLRYLNEREYDWHYLGTRPVHYAHAFEALAKEYAARTLLVDAGRTLNGILLQQGLVDQISLLVHPVVPAGRRFPLYPRMRERILLKRLKSKPVSGLMWMLFQVTGNRGAP